MNYLGKKTMPFKKCSTVVVQYLCCTAPSFDHGKRQLIPDQMDNKWKESKAIIARSLNRIEHQEIRSNPK